MVGTTGGKVEGLEGGEGRIVDIWVNCKGGLLQRGNTRERKLVMVARKSVGTVEKMKRGKRKQ